MKREVVKSSLRLDCNGATRCAIVVGSKSLPIDSALVAYTFASLFAAFGLTYRYAMWLQRPPTALYWRRDWKPSLSGLPKTERDQLVQAVIADFALNHFIWLRGKYRWLSPLVDHVGLYHCSLDHLSTGIWLAHVRIRTGDLDSYRIYMFSSNLCLQSGIYLRFHPFSRTRLGCVPCHCGCNDCHASPNA